MVGARLVAMVTSKARLPFCAIGPSTLKAPAPKLILSMSLIRVKNTLLKDTDGKRKIKRMVSFLSLDKGRLFFPKLSLKDETHEIFFTIGWSVY